MKKDMVNCILDSNGTSCPNRAEHNTVIKDLKVKVTPKDIKSKARVKNILFG